MENLCASEGYGEESAFDLLQRLYDFRRKVEVCRFLSQHASLTQALVEAYGAIRSERHFPNAHLALETLYDPEEEMAQNEKLIIIINTDFPFREALSRRRQMQKDWWLSTSKRSNGALGISLEYR
jgi:hypothetical protein